MVLLMNGFMSANGITLDPTDENRDLVANLSNRLGSFISAAQSYKNGAGEFIGYDGLQQQLAIANTQMDEFWRDYISGQSTISIDLAQLSQFEREEARRASVTAHLKSLGIPAPDFEHVPAVRSRPTDSDPVAEGELTPGEIAAILARHGAQPLRSIPPGIPIDPTLIQNVAVNDPGAKRADTFERTHSEGPLRRRTGEE